MGDLSWHMPSLCTWSVVCFSLVFFCLFFLALFLLFSSLVFLSAFSSTLLCFSYNVSRLFSLWWWFCTFSCTLSALIIYSFVSMIFFFILILLPLSLYSFSTASFSLCFLILFHLVHFFWFQSSDISLLFSLFFLPCSLMYSLFRLSHVLFLFFFFSYSASLPCPFLSVFFYFPVTIVFLVIFSLFRTHYVALFSSWSSSCNLFYS